LASPLPTSLQVRPRVRSAARQADRSNREWQRVRQRAGLKPELVLHSLRHSLGTAGIVAGMSSTLEVAKMLRHRNPSVTARYVHLAEAMQNRLHDHAADTLLG
jgi:integrase